MYTSANIFVFVWGSVKYKVKIAGDKKIYILHDCLSMSRPGGRKNEYLLVQNKCVKKKVKNEKKEK